MQYVQITEENITYTQNQCSDTCSEIYETQMAQLYDNLKLCLDGKAPVVTTVQPDKSTSEPETTVAPETTTTTLAAETAPIATTTASSQ